MRLPFDFRRSLVYEFTGTAMSNLGKMLHAIGWHKEALEMQNEALKFRRRVLPEHHPDIGEGVMARIHRF
jgi:hypothetical protein